MGLPINTKLLSHPINWIEIFLMLLIAGIIGHYTLQLLGIVSPTGRAQSSYANVSPGLKPGSVTGAIQPQSAGNMVPGQ